MKARKLLKVLLVIAIVLVILIGICISITLIGNSANKKLAAGMQAVVKEDALTPILDEETGYWSFTTDRDFKILHLTDVHIGGGFLSMKKDAYAINAVADLVTHVKPDLVIITGDMVFPVPFSSGSLNNMAPTKLVVELLESLGVHWTVTFGNHDSEAYSYYNREQISDYYEKPEWKYSLFRKNAGAAKDIDGFGNDFIVVKNSAGLMTQAIITMDSHSYTKGFYQDYDNIHVNQIEWYESEITRLDGINRSKGAAEQLKSLAFFHIPLVEYKTAWFEYVDNGMKNTDNVEFVYGIAGESGKVVYCGIGEDDLFETMQRLRSTQGIFTGHDHYNNFSINYTTEGYEDFPIRLTYGMSIDYLAYFGIYKETAQRGGTVITTQADGGFDCYGLRLADFSVIE